MNEEKGQKGGMFRQILDTFGNALDRTKGRLLLAVGNARVALVDRMTQYLEDHAAADPEAYDGKKNTRAWQDGNAMRVAFGEVSGIHLEGKTSRHKTIFTAQNEFMLPEEIQGRTQERLQEALGLRGGMVELSPIEGGSAISVADAGLKEDHGLNPESQIRPHRLTITICGADRQNFWDNADRIRGEGKIEEIMDGLATLNTYLRQEMQRQEHVPQNKESARTEWQDRLDNTEKEKERTASSRTP